MDKDLIPFNYSLINRGKTAAEINRYRLNLEKEIFMYKRSDLVHAVEVVIQKPDDCPAEQETAFFHECFNYVVSTLPMGERCVIVAEVHRDEHKYLPDGTDISKPHLHLMYIPAVPDKKHDGFNFRMCADALTRKKALQNFHPGLQKHLDQRSITATVYQKKRSGGKTIPLSVLQLKEITDKTGITIRKSLTVDDLAGILKEYQNIQIKDRKTAELIRDYEAQIRHLTNTVGSMQNELYEARETIKGLEMQLEQERIQSHTWGNTKTWGEYPAWGTIQNEEEIT